MISIELKDVIIIAIKKYIVIITTIILIGILISIAVINKNNKLASMTIGEKYLQQFDFKSVKVDESLVERYVIDMPRLLSVPANAVLLGLDNVDPNIYLFKNVELEKYEAFDHPLEQLYKSVYGQTNENVHIYVYLLIVDDNVIGGYSNIEEDNAPMGFGGFYNIEGKTLEDLIGMSYIEWIEDWQQSHNE